MHIGLIDVDDTDFPNLVLMKLSAWHKSQGDSVTLLKPDDVIKGQNLFQQREGSEQGCIVQAGDPVRRTTCRRIEVEISRRRQGMKQDAGGRI